MSVSPIIVVNNHIHTKIMEDVMVQWDNATYLPKGGGTFHVPLML